MKLTVCLYNLHIGMKLRNTEANLPRRTARCDGEEPCVCVGMILRGTRIHPMVMVEHIRVQPSVHPLACN